MLLFLNQIHLEQVVLLELLEIISQASFINADIFVIVAVFSIEVDVRVLHISTVLHLNYGSRKQSQVARSAFLILSKSSKCLLTGLYRALGLNSAQLLPKFLLSLVVNLPT